MKRGSMKFWLCVSLVARRGGRCARGGRANFSTRATPRQDSRAPRNETLLAGLRPGRDTFAIAEKRFKTKNLSEDADSGSKEWRDDCSGRAIRLEVDAKSVIQSVTITTLGPAGRQVQRPPAGFSGP